MRKTRIQEMKRHILKTMQFQNEKTRLQTIFIDIIIERYIFTYSHNFLKSIYLSKTSFRKKLKCFSLKEIVKEIKPLGLIPSLWMHLHSENMFPGSIFSSQPNDIRLRLKGKEVWQFLTVVHHHYSVLFIPSMESSQSVSNFVGLHYDEYADYTLRHLSFQSKSLPISNQICSYVDCSKFLDHMHPLCIVYLRLGPFAHDRWPITIRFYRSSGKFYSKICQASFESVFIFLLLMEDNPSYMIN